MEMTAHQQLTAHLQLAEKKMEQQRSQPDINPRILASEEKEIAILRQKLDLQPQ